MTERHITRRRFLEFAGAAAFTAVLPPSSNSLNNMKTDIEIDPNIRELLTDAGALIGGFLGAIPGSRLLASAGGDRRAFTFGFIKALIGAYCGFHIGKQVGNNLFLKLESTAK